jgi:hypothetical protein
VNVVAGDYKEALTPAVNGIRCHHTAHEATASRMRIRSYNSSHIYSFYHEKKDKRTDIHYLGSEESGISAVL